MPHAYDKWFLGDELRRHPLLSNLPQRQCGLISHLFHRWLSRSIGYTLDTVTNVLADWGRLPQPKCCPHRHSTAWPATTATATATAECISWADKSSGTAANGICGIFPNWICQPAAASSIAVHGVPGSAATGPAPAAVTAVHRLFWTAGPAASAAATTTVHWIPCHTARRVRWAAKCSSACSTDPTAVSAAAVRTHATPPTSGANGIIFWR